MVESNPIILTPIDDTVNTIQVFKSAATQPERPTGTTIPPSGWSLTPVTESSNQEITLKYAYSGNWSREGVGYKSNAITHGGITKERISFFTPTENIRIGIQITSYSETNYDYILVGKLDDDTLTRTSNYTDRVSGNGSTKTVWLTIPARGNHYVDIAYAKDSSTSSYGDYGIVQITQALRVFGLPIWASTIHVTNNVFDISWSLPVRWNGTQGDSGADGKGVDYIYLRGTGRNHHAERVLSISSQDNLSIDHWSRGLELACIDRFTLKVVSIDYFDVYGGNTEAEGVTEDDAYAEAARARFVSTLNGLSSNVFVCITSCDAVGWSHAMEDKLKEFGLERLYNITYHDTGVGGERQPFAFIGIKGLPRGQAYVSQQSDDTQAPYAELTAYIINGMFMSMPESSKGKMGRFFYYAGVWSNTELVSFNVTDAQAPYFSYTPSGGNMGYYVFNPQENGTYTMAQMGTPDPNNNQNWEQMVSDFKYLITEALFTDYAKLGGFVVNGDYMLSQYGYLLKFFAQGNYPEQGSGWEVYIDHDRGGFRIYKLSIDSKEYIYDGQAAYTYFYDIEEDTGNMDEPDYIQFMPKYCVNMATGKTKQGDGDFEGKITAKALSTDIFEIRDVDQVTSYYDSNGKWCASTVIVMIGYKGTGHSIGIGFPNAELYKGVKITFIAPHNDSRYNSLLFGEIRTMYGKESIGCNFSASSQGAKLARFVIQSDGADWWLLDAVNITNTNGGSLNPFAY